MLVCAAVFVFPEYPERILGSAAGMFAVNAGVVFLGIVVSLIVMYRVIEKITGSPAYSPRIARLSFIFAAGCGSMVWINMFLPPCAWGTVLGTGIIFVGLLTGITIWTSFSSLKEKTVEELAARWVSMGSWLPIGISSNYVAFGGWCLFFGCILTAASMFQTPATALMSTYWRDGLVKLIIIGGSGSFFIAAAYTAWSERSSTPRARVAEIGYWHYMAASALLFASLFGSGLVNAAQYGMLSITVGNAPAVSAMSAVWQRPFYVGIGIADIMLFASFLILGINLFRSRVS
jgi:hypothetical protein